jgi:hypothetical protein
MSVGSPQRSFLDGKSTEIDINTNSQQSAEDLKREISFVMDNDVIGAPMSMVATIQPSLLVTCSPPQPTPLRFAHSPHPCPHHSSTFLYGRNRSWNDQTVRGREKVSLHTPAHSPHCSLDRKGVCELRSKPWCISHISVDHFELYASLLAKSRAGGSKP